MSTPAGSVRTVLGDVHADRLGAVDYHEHLFQVSPLLPGDELTDEARSGAEAADLLRSGAAAMVEATPIGLGRDPEGCARISRTTGLGIVATTGVHRAAHYADDHWVRGLDADALADLLHTELTEGMLDGRQEVTSVRAGVLKAGVDYWRIGPFERVALSAVAAAHRRTGAPVMIHLEHGSATFEVLDLLADEGVRPDRVALAHVDRNPDPGLHAELAAAGAYLGYDGMARHARWPDSVLLACLAAVVAGGAGERVLLGGDVARSSRYRGYGGIPGMAYLFDRFVPRVRGEIGEGPTDVILRDNPARWLTWAPDASTDEE